MISINTSDRHLDLQDKELLREVLELLGFEYADSIPIEVEHRNGRYLRIDSNGLIYYVCVAARKEESRNSYIMQFLAPCYAAFVGDSSVEKRLAVYYPTVFGGDQRIARYHYFTNRLIKTIGASILNEEDAFQGKVSEPFRSFEELQSARDLQRVDSANHNSSSYVTRDTDGNIEIYGKTYGANMQETVVLVAAVVSLARSIKVVLFPVTDHSTTTHTASSLSIFEKLGVVVEGALQENPDTEEILREAHQGTVRNSSRFHYNLLRKFGPKKCYMCDCSIDTAIIGAHIHRVTDIQSDESITMDVKYLQAADGDNGLWLCATHDKLYEYGLIYYREDYVTQIAERLSAEQVQYVDALTTHKSFEAAHRTEATAGYLEKHRKRVLV